MSRRTKKRALPRVEREYPQAGRVFCTLYPQHFEKHNGTCFVPLEDYRKLETKYYKLFNRYKREVTQR